MSPPPKSERSYIFFVSPPRALEIVVFLVVSEKLLTDITTDKPYDDLFSHSSGGSGGFSGSGGSTTSSVALAARRLSEGAHASGGQLQLGNQRPVARAPRVPLGECSIGSACEPCGAVDCTSQGRPPRLEARPAESPKGGRPPCWLVGARTSSHESLRWTSRAQNLMKLSGISGIHASK